MSATDPVTPEPRPFVNVSQALWVLPVAVSLVVVALTRQFQTSKPATNDQSRAALASSGSPHLSPVGDANRLVWKQDGASIYVVRLSPDDARAVVAISDDDGKDQKIRYMIVDIGTGRDVCTLDTNRTGNPYFTPDGDAVAIFSLGSVILFDARTGEFKVEINPRVQGVPFDPIREVGMSADACVLVAAKTPKSAAPEEFRAWDTRTGERVAFLDGDYSWFGRGLSPDGRLFAAGGWPGPTPRVFRRDTGKRITYCFREQWPVAVQFTPDSRNLVTLHEDGVLVVWELRETGNDNARQLLAEPAYDDVTSFALASSGTSLAVAKKDGSIWLKKFVLP